MMGFPGTALQLGETEKGTATPGCGLTSRPRNAENRVDRASRCLKMSHPDQLETPCIAFFQQLSRDHSRHSATNATKPRRFTVSADQREALSRQLASSGPRFGWVCPGPSQAISRQAVLARPNSVPTLSPFRGCMDFPKTQALLLPSCEYHRHKVLLGGYLGTLLIVCRSPLGLLLVN
jgi:hypothetical protein